MIHHKEPKLKNGKIILFFCRKKCSYSEQGISLMLSLGYEVFIVYNEGKSDKLPLLSFSIIENTLSQLVIYWEILYSGIAPIGLA